MLEDFIQLHPNYFTVTFQNVQLVNLADKLADLFLAKEQLQSETELEFSQLTKPNLDNLSSLTILYALPEEGNFQALAKEKLMTTKEAVSLLMPVPVLSMLNSKLTSIPMRLFRLFKNLRH